MSEFVITRTIYEFDQSKLPAGSLVKITIPRYEGDEVWGGIIGSALQDRFDEEFEPQIKTVTVGGVVEWDEGCLSVVVHFEEGYPCYQSSVKIDAEDVQSGAVKIELLWRNDL